MSNSLKKIKLWSDIIATWVTIIGVFSGGAFALIEYLDKSQGERVAETLEYVNRYNDEVLIKARLNIEKFWNSRAEEVFTKLSEGEDQLSRYIDTTIRENDLEGDTNLLISFFENLRVCTCSDLCDPQTVRHFFGKNAYDLNGLVFPYISEQRKRLKDESIGVPLELLARYNKLEDSKSFQEAYCSY